jgi:guanylate kinase
MMDNLTIKLVVIGASGVGKTSIRGQARPIHSSLTLQVAGLTSI